MPVYRFTDGRKGWYFQFYFNRKKIKKERWKGKHMNSKIEAQQAEFECLSELKAEQEIRIRKNANPNQNFDDMNLYNLYDEYCKTAKNHVKITTFVKRYEAFRKLFLNDIGNKKIFELTPGDILEWKNSIIEIDSSDTYKNRLVSIMKNCLNYGLVMYNLSGRLQYPLYEKIKNNTEIVDIDCEKLKYIPEEDFEKLCQPLLEYQNSFSNAFYYYVVLNVLYYTGLRIGELAALTVNDFKGTYLIINKDYTKIGKEHIIQSPKSPNSVRKVTLDKETSTLIENYLKENKRTLPDEIIFRLKSNYLNQQKFRRVLKMLGDYTDLSSTYELHPHILRHSHASNLRRLGYDEYVISKRLGNTPLVSASIYIHSQDEEQIDLALNLRKNRSK